ncbi:hypothetical protein CRUP_003491, partial [Coryphaenoides rupestris]
MAPVDVSSETREKIEETREMFRSEYSPGSSGRYESADVRRLWEDDALVAGYLEGKHDVVADAVKMIDESLQWRKELSVNVWFRLKIQAKDGRTLQEKKRYLAFWLERFTRQEPGALLTAVFDMSESGLGNVDMDFLRFFINCFQDAFEYSYPPLPEGHSQAPTSDLPNQGEAAGREVTEADEPETRSRKVCFAEEGGDGDSASRNKPGRRPQTAMLKGSLLRFSPAGELCFGQSESDRRCTMLLDNITKNPVAYKVRTTAPDKYRASPQDRFLVMAAEMETAVAAENQDLAQFWKEIPKVKVMEH